jgi:uncharacterized membrane protein YdjX (TVP38/TMEM64 family)
MKGHLKILILISILAAGIIAQKMDLLDLTRALTEIEDIADLWWVPPASVLIQVALYMFALPGSIVIWTLGVIYHPLPATLLAMAGGTFGSLAAYFLAGRLSVSWTEKFSGTTVFKTLQRNAGFLNLCALRCLPGFPHSIINYSAGMLKVRVMPFILSSAVGFAFKGYIYSSAVYTAFHIEEEETAITLWTAWPLLVLAGFSLAGFLIQKLFYNGRRQAL